MEVTDILLFLGFWIVGLFLWEKYRSWWRKNW